MCDFFNKDVITFNILLNLSCFLCQVIKMLLAVIGLFLICWGPKLILNIMKRHHLRILHSNSAFIASVSGTVKLKFFTSSFVQNAIENFQLLPKKTYTWATKGLRHFSITLNIGQKSERIFEFAFGILNKKLDVKNSGP